MNPKKLTLRLRLLSNDIVDYFRGSCFGVPAMDPEVLRLWAEYNSILAELNAYDPNIFSDFQEIPYPAPYLADEESFFKEGTMIYKPEHFTFLKQAIDRLLKITIPLTWNKESA